MFFLVGWLIRPIVRVSIAAIVLAFGATMLGFDPYALVEPWIGELSPF